MGVEVLSFPYRGDIGWGTPRAITCDGSQLADRLANLGL